MTTYGVTENGFVLKPLSVIRTEKETSLRSFFGNAINLLPEELFGQYVGIESEREALIWELAQAVYYSQYPDTASGASKDYASSLTGASRLDATKSKVTVNAVGVKDTVIDAESVISVDGNPTARFETIDEAIIGDGTDEVQDIDFDEIPDDGNFTLIYEGEETAAVAWNEGAAELQTALNALTALSEVVVTGDYTAGFTVTFQGADGEKPHSALTVGTSTLQKVSVDVVITIVETTPGLYPNVDIDCQAETEGKVEAKAGTLTVIETVTAGWDSVSNAEDAEVGREVETDAEYGLRRLQTLSLPGASTPDAIRAKLLTVPDVTAALVFDNKTSVTDADGRPPKSIEAIVQGGDEDDIAKKIWDVAPGGIETYGSVTRTVEDSQGEDQTVKFSRPGELDIYLEADLTTNNDFPTGGEDAVEAAILVYAAANFGINDDVITTELYGPCHTVQGITDIAFRIATSNIALVQVLTFNADFVTGNTINGKIAGAAITPVPFTTDHSTTLSNLAAEIQSNSKITTATVTGAREITVTSLTAGDPGPLSEFVVTGGTTQPTSEIETTSHSDDNIGVDPDEISSWDSSRIAVTKL